MYICTFKYTPEDVDCQLCMLYRHQRCTAEAGCPYLAERIEASVADYAEVIRDTFKAPSFILAARLRQLLNSYCGPGWEDEQHYRRFGRCSPTHRQYNANKERNNHYNSPSLLRFV